MSRATGTAGLGPRGAKLRQELTAGRTFDPAGLVLVDEACRIADRLEQLDRLLSGDVETWASLVHDVRTETYVLVVNGALSEARQQANALRQIVATLGLGQTTTPSPTGAEDPLAEIRRSRAADRA